MAALESPSSLSPSALIASIQAASEPSLASSLKDRLSVAFMGDLGQGLGAYRVGIRGDLRKQTHSVEGVTPAGQTFQFTWFGPPFQEEGQWWIEGEVKDQDGSLLFTQKGGLVRFSLFDFIQLFGKSLREKLSDRILLKQMRFKAPGFYQPIYVRSTNGQTVEAFGMGQKKFRVSLGDAVFYSLFVRAETEQVLNQFEPLGVHGVVFELRSSDLLLNLGQFVYVGEVPDRDFEDFEFTGSIPMLASSGIKERLASLRERGALVLFSRTIEEEKKTPFAALIFKNDDYVRSLSNPDHRFFAFVMFQFDQGIVSFYHEEAHVRSYLVDQRIGRSFWIDTLGEKHGFEWEEEDELFQKFYEIELFIQELYAENTAIDELKKDKRYGRRVYLKEGGMMVPSQSQIQDLIEQAKKRLKPYAQKASRHIESLENSSLRDDLKRWIRSFESPQNALNPSDFR